MPPLCPSVCPYVCLSRSFILLPINDDDDDDDADDDDVTIRYDSVYLTCSKKLTRSQLSPPHGTNKKLKCETKNKTMSMIGPVQSRCHEGSPVG